MTTLIADASVLAIPVRDNGDRLVAASSLGGPAAGAARLVREGVAARLLVAEAALPAGLRLHLVEGFRRPAAACYGPVDAVATR